MPHKNIHKRRRDAGEACKKVKRQKLYEYTFIISTGQNVKKKQWANYCKTTQVSVAYAQVTCYFKCIF